MLETRFTTGPFGAGLGSSYWAPVVTSSAGDCSAALPNSRLTPGASALGRETLRDWPERQRGVPVLPARRCTPRADGYVGRREDDRNRATASASTR